MPLFSVVVDKLDRVSRELDQCRTRRVYGEAINDRRKACELTAGHAPRLSRGAYRPRIRKSF